MALVIYNYSSSTRFLSDFFFYANQVGHGIYQLAELDEHRSNSLSEEQNNKDAIRGHAYELRFTQLNKINPKTETQVHLHLSPSTLIQICIPLRAINFSTYRQQTHRQTNKNRQPTGNQTASRFCYVFFFYSSVFKINV